MGKEQATTTHQTEISELLAAWGDLCDDDSLRATLDIMRDRIKVSEWTYVDESSFSLEEEAKQRQREGQGKEEDEVNNQSETLSDEEDEGNDIYVDEDLFHKLGYGIVSAIVLSSPDNTKQETLHFHFSTHNWDVKNYMKPEPNYYCFSNKLRLEWERKTATSIDNANNNNVGTNISADTDSVERKNENEQQEIKNENVKEDSLIKIKVQGDKKLFDTNITLNESKIKDLQHILQLECIEGSNNNICFTYEDFVLFLFFSAMCMSVENQPYSDKPVISSNRLRRILLKEMLQRLGFEIEEFGEFIDNIAVQAKHIKREWSKSRFGSFTKSSSHTFFTSDDEAEGNETQSNNNNNLSGVKRENESELAAEEAKKVKQ